jgi:preprotein translocase subunit SecE
VAQLVEQRSPKPQVGGSSPSCPAIFAKGRGIFVVAKAEQPASSLDTLKLIVALIVLIGAVAGYYYFEGESQLFRVLGLLVVIGIAFFLVSITGIGRKALGFFKDARVEVRKVVWPTRQETIQTTLMVMIMVFIVALMLWAVDSVLGWGVRSILAA